jgi:two-component system KDP operon response regulator KdpE
MKSTSAAVLVIEGDRLIRRVLSASLPSRGFDVIEAAMGDAGLDILRSESPDLIILGLGLPDVPSLSLLRQICDAFDTPVVVLSNTAAVTTKVEALDSGASDYVTTPFNVDELAARLRVAMRNRLQRERTAPVFRNGELMVDLVHHRIMRGHKNIKLSPTEYAILRMLVIEAGRVLTHDYVLRSIWKNRRNIDYLRVYMRQLRKRIEIDPHNPQYILTVPGVGYRLLTGTVADEAQGIDSGVGQTASEASTSH